MVEAPAASLGAVIEEPQIRARPSIGRGWQQLINLNKGVRPNPRRRVHVNGGRAEGTVFIDGMDISSQSNDSIRCQPTYRRSGEPQDSVQYFLPRTARMGWWAQRSYQSGPNQLHGTLFHFLRNRGVRRSKFLCRHKAKYNFQPGRRIGRAGRSSKTNVPSGDYKA